MHATDTRRYVVVCRALDGREQTIVIHEARSGNAAANKAVREAAKRVPGRWYVYTCDPA